MPFHIEVFDFAQKEIPNIVLRLTTDARHTLPAPDYTKSAAQLYQETTVHIITQTGGLDVVSHVWQPNQEPEQPSWVPNWASEKAGRLLRQSVREETLFQATGTTHAKLKLPGNILTLTGILIDKITNTTEPADYKTNLFKFYQGWMMLARMHSNPFRPYIAGGDFCNAFWRAIIGNSVISSSV